MDEKKGKKIKRKELECSEVKREMRRVERKNKRKKSSKDNLRNSHLDERKERAHK